MLVVNVPGQVLATNSLATAKTVLLIRQRQ